MAHIVKAITRYEHQPFSFDSDASGTIGEMIDSQIADLADTICTNGVCEVLSELRVELTEDDWYRITTTIERGQLRRSRAAK